MRWFLPALSGSIFVGSRPAPGRAAADLAAMSQPGIEALRHRLADAFLGDRIKDLAGGRRHPVMTRPKTAPDVPIATVR